MKSIKNIIIGSILLAGSALVASTYVLKKNNKKNTSIKEVKKEENDRVYHELSKIYQDEENQYKLEKAI